MLNTFKSNIYVGYKHKSQYGEKYLREIFINIRNFFPRQFNTVCFLRLRRSHVLHSLLLMINKLHFSVVVRTRNQLNTKSDRSETRDLFDLNLCC